LKTPNVTTTGAVVVRKKLSRIQLLHFTANAQVELIGMAACAGSHFLGKALREQGQVHGSGKWFATFARA
jgi:hypothetical protein